MPTANLTETQKVNKFLGYILLKLEYHCILHLKAIGIFCAVVSLLHFSEASLPCILPTCSEILQFAETVKMSDSEDGGVPLPPATPPRPVEDVASLEKSIPVRPSTPKRAPPITSAEFSPPRPGAKPWTTARCYRLLRPLTSRIVRLYDIRMTNPTSEEVEDSRFRDLYEECIGGGNLQASPSSESDEKIIYGTYGFHPCDEDEEDEDPNWEPYGNRTKRIKVYKSKAITQLRQAILQVDEHVFNNNVEKTWQQTMKDWKPSLPFAWSSPSDSLRRERMAVLYETEMNCARTETLLQDAFKALLLGTQGSKPETKRVGVPSLVSLCLKKVPAYIELLETSLLKEDYVAADQVSNQVFADLENWGSKGEYGWKPIRVAVRAKGLKEMTDAIAEGILSPCCAYQIVRICKEVGNQEDIGAIYDALYEYLAPVRSPHRRDDSKAVTDLFLSWGPPRLMNFYDTMTTAGLKPLYFLILRDLFCRRIIPVEWLACAEVSDLWRPTVNLFDEEFRGFAEAISCWSAVFLLACGITPKEYLVQTDPEQSSPPIDLMAGPQPRDNNRSVDHRLTKMIHYYVASWIPLVSLFHERENAVTLGQGICDLASRIIAVQEAAPTLPAGMSRETLHRRAIILFGAMQLSACKYFEGYPSSLTLISIVREWVKVSYDVDLNSYVPLMVGPGYSPNMIMAFDRGGTHHNVRPEVRRLHHATHKTVRRTIRFLVNLASSESKSSLNIKLPRHLRRQLLRIACKAASELTKKSGVVPEHKELAEGLEHLAISRAKDCMNGPCGCFMKGCRECALPANEWRWDREMEEWVRPYKAPLQVGSESSRMVATAQGGYRGSRQATLSTHRTNMLSAFTDSPMPARSEPPHEVGSAFAVRSYQSRVLKKEEDPRQMFRTLSLSGPPEMDDEDELSILQEHPINSKVSQGLEKSATVKDLTMKKGHRRVSDGPHKLGDSHRIDQGRRIPPGGRIRPVLRGHESSTPKDDLKRKRGSIEPSGYGQDTSEDELAS
jgi:hypothetical protein